MAVFFLGYGNVPQSDSNDPSTTGAWLRLWFKLLKAGGGDLGVDVAVAVDVVVTVVQSICRMVVAIWVSLWL